MRRLAICVPTVDHSNIVEQTLFYSIEYLQKHEVDIYYYDSSENDETKNLVILVNNRGYSNAYHIPVSAGLSYGEKIDLIFSGHGLVDDYEYIWPMKDRVICNEQMLQLVLATCETDPDVVISLTLGSIFRGDHAEIDSSEELYRVFAKQTTSLETVVYSTKTTLNDYVYGNSQTATKYQNDFWHYHFLYNRLAEMSDTKIGLVSGDGACNMVSSVTEDSFWHQDFFEVWIEEWIKLNYELPDIYSEYKLQVIKDTTSIRELLGDMENFIKLHKEGLLTRTVFEKYSDMWNYVTPVPVDEIKRIAYDERY